MEKEALRWESCRRHESLAKAELDPVCPEAQGQSSKDRASP